MSLKSSDSYAKSADEQAQQGLFKRAQMNATLAIAAAIREASPKPTTLTQHIEPKGSTKLTTTGIGQATLHPSTLEHSPISTGQEWTHYASGKSYRVDRIEIQEDPPLTASAPMPQVRIIIRPWGEPEPVLALSEIEFRAQYRRVLDRIDADVLVKRLSNDLTHTNPDKVLHAYIREMLTSIYEGDFRA